jgi:hypothetical protein
LLARLHQVQIISCFRICMVTEIIVYSIFALHLRVSLLRCLPYAVLIQISKPRSHHLRSVAKPMSSSGAPKDSDQTPLEIIRLVVLT